MTLIKHTIAPLLAASLIGCAASPVSVTEKNITVEQAVCCESAATFGWIPLAGNTLDITIDNHSPVANFASENTAAATSGRPDDKSHFAAFSLPDNVNRMQVELSSWMTTAGVFAPQIQLFAPDFTLVKTVGLDSFTVKPSDMFHLSSYKTRFQLDRETTPYMVVYSPKDLREGQITIPHPERLRAEELGLARPMVVDPVIQHQKFGQFQLALKPLSLRAYQAHAARPSTLESNGTASAAAPKNTGSAGISVVPAMKAESEAFYRQQIENAVKNGELESALEWLEEAKRAGSKTAQASFINAVSQ